MDRVDILAAALEDAVMYLRRLPVVPATSMKIHELEAALVAPPPRAQSAEARSPAGLSLLEVEVSEGKLTLRTDLPRERAGMLWRALAGEGMQVVLRSSEVNQQAGALARRGR